MNTMIIEALRGGLPPQIPIEQTRTATQSLKVGDTVRWVSKEDRRVRTGTIQSVGQVNVYVSVRGRLSVPLYPHEVTLVTGGAK